MSGTVSFADLGRVHWIPTIKLAVSRGLFSGLIWAIIVSLGPAAGSTGTVFSWPFIWSIAGLPFALIFQLAGMIFSNFMPLLGLWFHFVGSLMICIGDPLVYLVNRSFPTLLSIADLSLFNFRPMIFVMRRA